jgi:Spy/CpxP family protein refolding chaperone
MTRDELLKQYELLADRADWLRDWGGSGAMSPYIRDAMMAALNLTAHAIEQLEECGTQSRKERTAKSQRPKKRIKNRAHHQH